MKLKTKIMFSIMSIIMLIVLFMLVESGARLTGSFVEKYIDGVYECEEVEIYLASVEGGTDTYIISETDGGYAATSGEFTKSAESLSELISQIEADGATLCFDSVRGNCTISVTRKITFTGSLTLSDGDISSTSEGFVLDGCAITLDSGSVRVKSGKTTLVSGSVKSRTSSAFVLDYSSSSRLDILGGEICVESKDAALVCKIGYVSISGGFVSNPFGMAIEAESTVELSGNAEIIGFEYGIKTNKPIVLSGKRGVFVSSLSVLYDASFEQGTCTEVFREAEASVTENIRLYDKHGELHTLTFFEALSATDERNFLAVYLPYEIKYYSGSALFHTEKILKNETIREPDSPMREGYVFSGWYREPSGENAYTFGESLDSDLSLYASFSLSVPTFRINSKGFVYDGDERSLSFDELSHPLAEFGSFSFEWYKNSVAVPYSSSSIPLKTVEDSGIYRCKLTFSYNGDFVTVITSDITVAIEKCCVEIPVIAPYQYTGSKIEPYIPQSTLYSFVYSSSTDVGSYPVTFTLTDSENYEWRTNDTQTAVVNYEILPSENLFLSTPSVKDCFVGGLPQISAEVKFGVAVPLYSSDGVSFAPDIPSAPGSYYLKLTVPASTNYLYLESDVIDFRILPEVPVGIKLDKAPDKTDYVAFETLVLDGAEFSVTYNSGRVDRVDISDLDVRYKYGECFLVSDNCAIVCYGAVSVPVTVNVSTAEYDISAIAFDSKEVIYNGKRQTISAYGEVIGIDGIALKTKVTGGGVNVGVYTVTLNFESDSINYRLPDSITKTLTVTPMYVPVEFGETSFVYDGTSQAPPAYARGATGSAINVSVSGAATNAGTYTATASTTDPNYILTGAEVTFEIKRADLDFSSVKWSGTEFVYDAIVHSVTVSGLPAAVTVAGYTDSSFTNAGEYVATASIVYDSENYNEPPALTHKWRILPADYDFSDCIFLDSEYVYDGAPHYPEIVGVIPTGADGSKPTFAFSRGITHVSEGVAAVTVSFHVESKNYKVPQSLIVFVRILPKPISVEWGELNFVYDGNTHLPSASSELCEIEIYGSAINAGTYLATAVTHNTDYTISNSRVAFVISKGQNFWISTPVVGVQFEGRAPVPHAKAHYGEAEYSYYSDFELKKPISAPTNVGTYYVVASVSESANYSYLSHEPIELKIIAVEPVELAVEFDSGSLVATRALGPGDFRAYLINNDGSKTELSFADMRIEYENGAALQARDKKITLSYGSFEKSFDIEVSKAYYDMSGVHWSLTDAVYTGDILVSQLLGLPFGVSVKEYVSNSGKLAGMYELRASLSYDAENYYEPSAPLGLLSISRAEIALPSEKSAVYDGTLKNILIPEDALYASSFAGAVEVGIYDIRIIPKDNANYTVAGEGIIKFEILPAPITLEVSEEGDSYSLVSGKIFEGDTLGEEYYTEDGMVYLKISNTNYDLTVIPSAEPDSFGITLVFFIIMLGILLILGSFILYTKREKIISMLEGRSKNNVSSEAGDVKAAEPAPSTDALPSSAPRLELLLAVDEPHANSLISDSLAKNLVTDSEVSVQTDGKRKCIVNVEAISKSFAAGDSVDINKMKARGIVPRDAKRVKVLAGGIIDKPLTVIADSFSLAAVKMIALTGGRSVRARSGIKSRGTKQ